MPDREVGTQEQVVEKADSTLCGYGAIAERQIIKKQTISEMNALQTMKHITLKSDARDEASATS